ncbi:MAG: polysaccharide deacetylase family protein [Bacteroidales bacterium]|nr:polysaccharide deacetylase family protein [Bacteroidales bacterium]
MYILSFDIEDWFHIFHPAYENKPELWNKLNHRVESNTQWVLDFLSRHQLRATFFCLGWVAEKYPQLIKSIHEAGHEVAAHSYMHNKISNLNPETFFADTKRVIDILENLTGSKITTYRAPGFSMNKNTLWAFEILHDLGIENDSSFKSGLFMGFSGRIPNEPFVLKGNGFELREFPTRTFNFLGNHLIYSGSGYFRVYPYSFIQKMFRASKYEMAYYHPRDFDNGIHNYLNNHAFVKLKYRIGTNSSRKKLDKLVREFDFVTMEKAVGQFDWENAVVFDLMNGENKKADV